MGKIKLSFLYIAESIFKEKPWLPETENDEMSHGHIRISTAGRDISTGVIWRSKSWLRDLPTYSISLLIRAREEIDIISTEMAKWIPMRYVLLVR